MKALSNSFLTTNLESKYKWNVVWIGAGLKYSDVSSVKLKLFL